MLVDLQQEPLAELKRLTGRERGQDRAEGRLLWLLSKAT